MSAVLPVLSSGTAPQCATIMRVVVDPKAVIGEGYNTDNDNNFNCPPGVPLFTTYEGITSLSNKPKPGRSTGTEDMIPVIFNIPTGVDEQDLYFIGVSYNSASRKQSVISVVTGGLVSVPLGRSDLTGKVHIGVRGGWKRSVVPYGSTDGPHIGVPDFVNDLTTGPICGYVVQRITYSDCTILLGNGPSSVLPGEEGGDY